MNVSFRKSLSLLVLLAGLSAPLAAQVTLKRGAVVYCGNASNTTAPAFVDEAKAKEATKEWQKIQSEGIDPDSAQGKQLLQKMNSKVREALKWVAQDESGDRVVRKDDFLDKQGKEAVDLTDKVVAKLGE